ncbi:MAG: hypothetical protein ACLFR6_04910 [Salinarchaeum sp.]
MTVDKTTPDLGIGDGQLLQSRVIENFGRMLEMALEDRLTGYVRIESGDALVLDTGERGVITFEDGVPMVAYHAGRDVAGERALATLSTLGPFRVDVYALESARLATIHADRALSIPPGRPAERLAGDPGLARRTRAAAPEDRLEATRRDDDDALAAFLADEERIEAIREQAREEAERRAAAWGFTDALEE